MLERERPAAAASGRSFGWINASFGHPDAYQQLRYLAMLEYLRLEREVPGIQVNWSGSLVWLPDAAGDSLARLVRAQQRRGYPVRSVEAREFAALEPSVRPAPALAAFAEREAAVDPAHTTVALLEAAQKSGAQVAYPVTVTGFDLHGDRLRAVETGDGAIGVDVAVLAAGVDTPRLAREAQLRVPLKESPALLLRTRPLEQTAARILVTPQAQVKQQVDGMPDGNVSGFDRGGVAAPPPTPPAEPDQAGQHRQPDEQPGRGLSARSARPGRAGQARGAVRL